MSAVEQFDIEVARWLYQELGANYDIEKHSYSHQDEVYRLTVQTKSYYVKVSTHLQVERDNLHHLMNLTQVPKVLAYQHINGRDHLLMSELPGKNLAEYVGQLDPRNLVYKFAHSVHNFHKLDPSLVFPDRVHTSEDTNTVVLHGDMALPNIIYTRQGVFSGYIDLGQVSLGSPDTDLADAIWSIQRNMGPGYGELFLKAYGAYIMTDKIEQALAFIYHP